MYLRSSVSVLIFLKIVDLDIKNQTNTHNGLLIQQKMTKSQCVRGLSWKSSFPFKHYNSCACLNSTFTLYSFTGPCLKIEDTILSWVEGRYQGDVVVKATYVLIEGLAGDMCSNYIYLQNCGTTSIKYHWMVSPRCGKRPIRG